MPRRIVKKKSEIYKLRAMHWERNYAYRQDVKAMIASGRNGELISHLLYQSMEPPIVDMDGGVGCLNLSLEDRRTRIDLMYQLEIWNNDLLCWFWWSESAWTEYVRQFNALPEPVEDYYLYYIPATDQAFLKPVSWKEPGTTQVQPRYKSGTSREVVPAGREKWRSSN